MKGQYLRGFLQLCWGRLEEVALLGPLFSPASGPAQPPAWPAVQLEVQLYSYLLELSPWQCQTDCPVLSGVWLGLLKVEGGGAQASWPQPKPLFLFTYSNQLCPVSPSFLPPHPFTSFTPQPFEKPPHLDTGLEIQRRQFLLLPPFPPSVSSSAVSFPSEAAAFLLGSSPSPLPKTQTHSTSLPQ